ncbi:MAG TPA: hypothetical protein PKA00_12865 [Saprospiraceae bacterium]|nr:hypothetical protein [Saprospiraceae bacterium]HMQ83800.1 hypothetical protein [Saprospiraceae bacterium]
MKRLCYLLLFFCQLGAHSCHAQWIVGLAARWNDDFSEWVILTDDETLEGQLNVRWPQQNDWGDWQYRLGEAVGTIQLKWANNWNEWEARGDNEIATARTVWNNNFREWRISDSQYTFTLRTRFGNLWDEWEIRSNNAGAFSMATRWEGDPRDWNVWDELPEELPMPTRMLLVFIVMHQSTAPFRN